MKGVGHMFVGAKFRGKDVLEVDGILVDVGASFTVMPLNLAEKHFIETPFEVELKVGCYACNRR
jgi:hypothetical protein